ncbi:MAG: glyoxalase superfamily protein [Parvularculaceae bacterium]
MRLALDTAGYDDIPKNGLYVIGGLALEERSAPLSTLINDLGLSKQAAGQLVDTLVARGYLGRRPDLDDRRRLIISLTDRGMDAARIQARARDAIDRALEARVGNRGILAFRKALAALSGIGREPATKYGTPAAACIKKATPILFVSNVANAAHFYVDILGFEIDFLYGEQPFYGSVSRDGARLHLRYVNKPNFADLAATEEALILATIEVTDVRAILAEFERRKAPISRALVQQAWGGTDFHIRDPDGNEISFVEYHASNSQNESQL